MKRFLFTTILILCTCAVCLAQSERKNVRRGNRDFRKSRYEQAEIDYKKALLADSTSAAAAYNLGNTYYRLENFTEADKYFKQASDSLASTKYGADSYHNAGNSMLRQRNWQGAIDAYKNALRRNPDDMDTKTNLAYAQKMLENEQQNQNQDQNQDQNQNQNQDQNQDQDQNKDQNKDDNQNDKDQQDQQNQQNQQDRKDGGQQPKISPQAAQQMLQAIQAQEKETQDKVNREKALKLQSKQKEKNW
ncbi:MAG: tetratricopeptide repeat protein [Bacteroidales bacterium]|nr:tetratricopeptide repeat protein [Candidatus Cacconaster caballi]